MRKGNRLKQTLQSIVDNNNFIDNASDGPKKYIFLNFFHNIFSVISNNTIIVQLLEKNLQFKNYEPPHRTAISDFDLIRQYSPNICM